MKDKVNEYSMKLIAQIEAVFNEDCNNHIDFSELSEGDNGNDFVHALANVAPAMMVFKLTGECYDALGFNHMVNRLAAQYSIFVDKNESISED